MSIASECPHCETRFNLQPELAGKVMRCPNCRDVFEVREVSAPQPAPPPAPPPAAPGSNGPAVSRVDAPRPTYATGSVSDFLPVLEAENAAPSPPPETPRGSAKSAAPKPEAIDALPLADAESPEDEVVEAVVVAPPPPAREVVWTPDAELPPTAASPREKLVLPRRKRKSRAPVILAASVVATVALLAFGAIYFLQIQARSEALLAEQAKKEYEHGNYAVAAKTYAKLAAEWPESEDAEKYRFFADLSAMQVVVRSVTNRENPRPALEKFRGFVTGRKDSPFVKPESGYGRDLLEAGKKLEEDMVGHAEDRVKAFREDRSKGGELKQAEETIASGRDLLPLLNSFRAKEDPPLDNITTGFDKVKADIDRERNRLDVIAQAKTRLANPDNRAIEEVKSLLAANGLATDPEGQAFVQAAESRFLQTVRYEADPAAPRSIAAPAARSLLFAPSIGPVQSAARGELDEPPTAFLAIARGVLHALDEDTGALLWAARVGPDVFDPPAVARVELADGPADLAVVVSNVAGRPAVSGYTLRTGQPRWQQPLIAPAAGRAAVVGSRAFVPLRDPAGTVCVLDLVSGTRLGRIVLGQPIGAAVARPDAGQLIVTAESRRLFVFDVAASNEEGTRIRCARVISTNHPAGTLRAPPTVVGPPADSPGAQWLVLCQADGPTGMKLRAFPLPTDPPQPADAPPIAEAGAAAVELSLPGWVSFPPTSDGERLLAATDAGQIRLFGVNQPGNRDPAVFPLPSPTLPTPPDGAPVPGVVVPAEEGAFWALVGGSLQKYQVTLLPDRGQTVVPVGKAEPVGIPTQPAQLNPRRDTACFVVRSANSQGHRVVAVRLQDGEPRWQRQVGVMPAEPPVPFDSGVMVVDTDGGVVAVPSQGLALPPGTTKAPQEWAISASISGVSGPTRVAGSVDGKVVFTLTPTQAGDTKQWVIRRVVGGKVEHAGSVQAPAPLAGPPAVLGGTLLIPAADGFVYRLTPGDGRLKPDALTQGPRWWTDRKHPDAVGFITILGEDSFLTSDGGRALSRWAWPAVEGWADGGARWEVRERIAAPPIVLPAGTGRPARLLVADAAGGIWLHGLDRGESPIRRWVPGRTVSLPSGKVSSGFGVHTDDAGRQTVCYSVDGKRLVCLDTDSDDPRWVVEHGNGEGGLLIGSPQPADGGHWLVTDLAGRVSIVDSETGKVVEEKAASLPGTVPATAGVFVGGSRVVLPLSDGSVTVVEFLPTAPTPRVKQ